jgi:hypothetical protein
MNANILTIQMHESSSRYKLCGHPKDVFKMEPCFKPEYCIQCNQSSQAYDSVASWNVSKNKLFYNYSQNTVVLSDFKEFYI